MPTYYEGSVGSVKTQITREEFSQAWRLDQEKNGRLKNIGVKRAAAVAAFLLVLVWGIPVYSRYFDTIWAPLVLAAGCGFAIFYYGFLLPHWVSQQGEASFDSQKLLGEPCEIQLYRDSYQIRNRWETISGHWTDHTACMAVSYTHLDVYKRQSIQGPCLKWKRIPCAWYPWTATVWLCARKPSQGAKSCTL